jgi:cell division protein FtsL
VPRGQRQASKLPSWGDLARGKNERAPAKPQGAGFMAQVSTVRFALLILALAASFTLYVGHVHATQEVLAEVQQAQKENLRLHLKYNRLKGAFDQATSPAVIYQHARDLGLEEGLVNGPVIRIEE